MKHAGTRTREKLPDWAISSRAANSGRFNDRAPGSHFWDEDTVYSPEKYRETEGRKDYSSAGHEIDSVGLPDYDQWVDYTNLQGYDYIGTTTRTVKVDTSSLTSHTKPTSVSDDPLTTVAIRNAYEYPMVVTVNGSTIATISPHSTYSFQAGGTYYSGSGKNAQYYLASDVDGLTFTDNIAIGVNYKDSSATSTTKTFLVKS